MLKVYYAKIDALYSKGKYLTYYQALPKARQKRANNYINEEDRMRSVAVSTLLIKLLNENKVPYQNADFKINQYGKLFLANSDIYFNLSHSGNYVIAGISDAPIGVDVERIESNRKIKELINKLDIAWECNYGDYDCDNCSDLEEETACTYKIKNTILQIINEVEE